VRWIALAGYLHLFLFGILIPISAIRSKKLIESRPLPPRRKYFVSVFIQVGCFALFSIAVAHLNRIEVFPGTVPPLRAIVAGVLFLVLAVMFGWTTWRKAVLDRERVVALFMPTNNVERLLWIGSAALAGFGEEITWRGVQTALLTRLTGSVAVAIIIAIATFAIAHAMQGWKSVGVIAIFTAGFHALVWLSGSLYVAMAVHFIYDLTAGLTYGRLGRELGYPDAPQPPAAPVEAGTEGGPGL